MYNEKDRALIWLSTFDFMYYKKEENFLSLFDKPEDVFKKFETKKDLIKKVVGDEHYNLMKIALQKSYLDNFLLSLEKANVKVITKFNEEYPAKLKQVDSPPFVLYLKGDISLLKTTSVGIVGTRKPTYYGRSVTESFSKTLAKNGFTIVSGLAYGIDTVSHRTTLDNNGKTIAVLGGGFNCIYPASNTNLADEIANQGLLVSEYKPSTPVSTFSFPIRNRIIAGLSDVVLITEAGEKSGALHTKEYAINAGKEVFVIPGNINSPESAGTNRLIKTCQTLICTSVQDILDYFGKTTVVSPKQVLQLSIDEKLIINELEDGEKSFAELQEKTKLDSKTLNSCLTSLQIRGIIKKLPGNYYAL